MRYNHFGEGGYDETELQMRALLTEAGHDVSDIPANSDPGPQLDTAVDGSLGLNGTTRELYAGYERNIGALRSQSTPYVRHVEYYENLDVEVDYIDPGDHENHFLHLEGLWRNGPESLLHARETSDYDDYIGIKFYGTSVNAVMEPADGMPLQVKVTLGEAPAGSDESGADIQYDPDGNSFIEVGTSRMYFVLNRDDFGGGELRLSSNSPEFSLFAFTFGAYEGGEPNPNPTASIGDGYDAGKN